MMPLALRRSREPFHLLPWRWLAAPLVTFAIGAVLAVLGGPAAGRSADVTVGAVAIERELAAAQARAAARTCAADSATREDFERRWHQREELAQTRALEARDPAAAIRAELRRIERGFALPTCAPTTLGLVLAAADVEDAVRHLAAMVHAGPITDAERAALIAALDRPAPRIDVAALNDGERDFSLTWIAAWLPMPLVHDQALEAGYDTLRQHRLVGATCTAAMPAAACARALEHETHVNRAFPYAIREVLDAHAMVGELRDELIAAR